MKSIYKIICGMMSLSLLFTACADSDNYDAPEIEYHTKQANITIEELYDLADATVKQFEEDLIVEAYVSSSDEGGTFYKSLSLQNREGTKGFSMSVDAYNIYTLAEPGRKVYIELKDLYYTIQHGSLVIGDLYQEISVGRMRPQMFSQKVFLSAEKVAEEDLMRTVTIRELQNDNFINILVQINEAQFAIEAVGNTYYDAANVLGGATNHILIDATGRLIFRTSSFAKFGHVEIPFKSGSVRGVMTKYNSDYQFLARTLNDIQLNNDYIYEATHKGGTNIVFNPTVFINFESYAVDSEVFPEMVNDQTAGGRYWATKTFSGNKYAQITSFGGGGVTANAYLFVPAQFTGTNAVSFETKDGYYRGETLKVYYVPQNYYEVGQYITKDNFVDITANFTISKDNAEGYGANFIPSGSFTIPFTGNGYIVFEYSGTPTVSTTMQIDNIRVE